MNKLFKFSALSLLIATAPNSWSGSYGPQNFDSFAVGTTNLGDGSVMGSMINGAVVNVASIQNRLGSTTDRALRLTQDETGSTIASFKLPPLDPSAEVTSFDVNYVALQYSPNGLADGYSITYGAVSSAGTDHGGGEVGFTAQGALVVAFDTYANVANDAPRIKVFANGVQIASVPPPPTGVFTPADTTYHAVSIHWDANGLDLTYGGNAVFTNLAVPGFFPAPGDRFAFSGRTGGVNQETQIDNLHIVTTVATPITTTDVVISEFVADNGDGIEDEDTDRPDWLEIYNGTPNPVNLTGWRLSNTEFNLGLWTFPSLTLQPFTYLRIFASGKDRRDPSGVLHTNFTLNKDGGYLALVKPDGTTKTSEFNFGPQSEDVSFGTYGESQILQYMMPPTPGAKNERPHVEHADGPPAEDVVFSRDGGLITAATTLSVVPPVAAGAVVRYTTDGTVPDAADPVFPATPLNITSSSNIRARVFQPGRLPGDLNSRSFLFVDGSLTNYAGSGQPFNSNLPIIVVESWGGNIDSVSNPAGARPYRPVYTVVLAPDPANGNRASISGLVDFHGRGGMHVRGQTSASFGQKPYAWETWTNEDDDKDVPLLGFPADSDWILQTPYNDKSLMRNALPYQLMRELHGAEGAVRSRFVEVFFNQDGGPISYADYRGVYILMERIQRSGDRIDITELSPLSNDPERITGGYIFKKDKLPVSPMYTTTSPSSWGTQIHEITEPEDASAAQIEYLRNYVQQFDAALSGANYTDPTTGYRAYIEPESFMENHLWVEVFKQIDGYRISTYYTKERGQKIKALPIWDYNLSSGNANYLTGDQPTGWYYTQIGGGDYPYYPRLLTDPDFRLRYWDTYWKLRRTKFTTANIHAKIDAWANELTDNKYATPVTNGVFIGTGAGEFFPTDKGNNLPPSQEAPARAESPAMRHFDRWPILGVHVWPNPAGSNTRTTYQSEVQWMKDWLANRLNWIDTQFTRPPNFSLAGGNVPSGSQLTITNPNASGQIYYSTDGTDPYTGEGANAPSTLIPENPSVKWLVPTGANGGFALTAGAGANQWTNFTDPPNIGNWTTATAGVGYDTNLTVNYLPHIGAGGNTQAAMFNINATVYVRVTFNIPDQATLDSIGSLVLGLKYDDGFRAYINGTPVAGRNDTHISMTENPWSAQANAIHDDNAALLYEDIDISLTGKSALRVGTNVLAIHGLNSPATSTDFLLAPRLKFGAPPQPGEGAQLYTGPLSLNSSALVRSRVLISGSWSPITEAAYVVNATPASASNLVVSEFCYDPQASGIYTSKDLEFIVVRNISAGSVDLTGLRLSGAVEYTIAGTPQMLTLPPGGEAVIAANPTALQAVHGPPPTGVQVFGPFSGALDNGAGETLRIEVGSGEIVKEFTYSVNPPWPSGVGRSIVLQRPWTNPNHNDGHNWRGSVATRGTPYASDSVPFLGDWAADDDKDGYANGVEYSLGTDAASALSKPAIGATTGTEFVNGAFGRYLRLSFRRSRLNDQGALIPELSLDLATWNSGANVFTRIIETDNGDGTVTEVWRTTNPVPPTRAFGRIRLVSP